MFSKIALPLVSRALLVSGVMSSPIGQSLALGLAARGGPVSFDHWGGFDSLDNFDNFYGVNNFAHFNFEQVVVQKTIITEQICEVETQTVVYVGYNSSITGHYGDLFGDNESLSVHDLGFSGSDVGQNTVVVGGSNWNNATLPAYINNAFSTAQGAHSGL
ncbi:hypothetical protein CPB85DRAFT_1252608 [Mucidula mucida]|nr:hypothetical protein CPB85DRAFT_1252608 [Mucidula mucida]